MSSHIILEELIVVKKWSNMRWDFKNRFGIAYPHSVILMAEEKRLAYLNLVPYFSEIDSLVSDSA